MSIVMRRSNRLPDSELDAFTSRLPGSQMLPEVERWNPALLPPVNIVYWGALYGQRAVEFWNFKTAPQNITKCKVPCILTVLNYEEYDKLRAADGVIMYGSNFNPSHGPVYTEVVTRRPLGQSWLLHMSEATSNYPSQGTQAFASYFNYTSGFSQDTDYPVIWNTVVNHQRLSRLPKYKDRLAKVSCLYTNCASKNGREQVIEAVKHALPGIVDCMGPCGRNAPFPSDIGEHKVYWGDGKFWDHKDKLQSRYRFDLVVQNSNCEGAADEKLWDALDNGLIPLYYGAWDVKDMLPQGYKMIIDLREYYPHNMKGLADLINKLNTDEAAYNEYFTWHDLVKKSPRGLYTLPAHRKKALGTYSAEENHSLHLEVTCWFCQRILADRMEKRVNKIAKADASCCDGSVNTGCPKFEAFKSRTKGNPFGIKDGIYPEWMITGLTSRVGDGTLPPRGQ
jgi:hypothetical protein